MHLHGLDRSRRDILAPQRDRQPRHTHRLIRVQQQNRKHRARLGARDRHRTTVGAHLKRTQNPELH